MFWLQKADTVQARQDQVHDHHIGLGLLDQLPRFVTVSGIAYDLELAGLLQGAAQQ